MAYLLSDDELRRKLELLGEDVGPVTATTRRPMQKKLDSLLKGQNRTLNVLSSDDSEVEQQCSPQRSMSKKKRHNHRTSHIPPIAQQLSNLNLGGRKEIFKKPLPTPPRHLSPASPDGSPLLRRNLGEYKASRLSPKSFVSQKGRTNIDLELSDSDLDTESLLNPMRTLKLRNKNTNHVLNDSSEGYLKRSHKFFLPNTLNGDDFTHASRNVDQKQKDWQINVPRKSYRLYGSSDRKYTKEYNANGYLMRDPLNGVFNSESKSPGRTTNYSFCVSWMLVLMTTAFFLFLGIFYMSAVQKTQFANSRSYLDSFICRNNNRNDCIPQEYFRSVLLVSRDLHDLLSSVAGEFECHAARQSRSLSPTATKMSLEPIFSNYNVTKPLPFDKVFDYAILLSLKNPDWGINVFREGKLLQDGKLTLEDVKFVSALESKHASKSLWCRLQHSIYWTMTKLLLTILIAVFLCLSFIIAKYWKKQKDLEEKEFFELVEKILDVLQSPDEASPSQSSASLPCKAVAHLRDQIIPVKERRAKQHLWDKAVNFIEENESRVQVDYERIGGEDFKVWRWLPSPVSESEEGKKGKVWQGQAFGSPSKGKNHVPYSPTPCLKIRNMFDSEVEYGDDWQVCIKDAILEKCEGNNGIVHIAVDTSSKEGCVYMLCDCPESAGKAYSALHGWWFDGKLVTVKYLRLERYLQRFPDAEDCEEPLKPSNNKRLSLSTPYFSSALERS